MNENEGTRFDRRPRKSPPMEAAMEKLRGLWLKTQPATHDNSIGGVLVTRDEAAALFEYVRALEGRKPA